MGVADVIPGVSGGTMALIMGIYGQLIEGIKSLSVMFLIPMFKWIFSGFKNQDHKADMITRLKAIHWNFLIFLGLGIGVAIITGAKVITLAFDKYPSQTLAFFFGLILASVVIPYRMMNKHKPYHFLMGAASAVGAFFLVGLPFTSVPNPSLAYIFLCAVIAICAMILPGISGAFILLVLGQYEYVLTALKGFDIKVIVIFLLGAGLGIVTFARVLSFLLKRWHDGTMIILAGFMIGSLRKVWPFKDTYIKTQPGENIIPQAFDSQVTLAIVFFVVGVVAVILLDRVGRKKLKKG